jgi:galactosylceramidase
MWNLDFVNDWTGAAALAHDLSEQARWGISASIIWCLIFSWFAPLPFSRPTDTNAGLGHALLVAAEPWSGNYVVSPTVHVVAHHTQFAKPGWYYLGGSGMGVLSGGGSYVTRMNLRTPSAQLEFSITIDVMGVKLTQSIGFSLEGLSERLLPTVLHVWVTTQNASFVSGTDVPVALDGTFSVSLPADAMVTVTTTTGQGAPKPKVPIPISKPFPFPYSDNFDVYPLQGYAKFFSDEGGIFVVDSIPKEMLDLLPYGKDLASGAAYHQLIDVVPIAWETNPTPYTLIGNFNGGAHQKPWADYIVSVSAALDLSVSPLRRARTRGLADRATAADATHFLLLSARIRTYTRNGVPPDGYNLFIHASETETSHGSWDLAFGAQLLANGTTPVPIVPGTFYRLAIRLEKASITATLDGVELVTTTDSRSAFGMAAFGSSWSKSWFDNFAVSDVAN